MLVCPGLHVVTVWRRHQASSGSGSQVTIQLLCLCLFLLESILPFFQLKKYPYFFIWLSFTSPWHCLTWSSVAYGSFKASQLPHFLRPSPPAFSRLLSIKTTEQFAPGGWVHPDWEVIPCLIQDGLVQHWWPNPGWPRPAVVSSTRTALSLQIWSLLNSILNRFASHQIRLRPRSWTSD